MRSLVVAPFFSNESTTNRPLLASEVLARFGDVDIVTTDFDHHRKSRKPRFQFERDGRTVYYVRTREYRRNIGVARLISHALFTYRAWQFLKTRRGQYDLVYATVPFNLLAFLSFKVFGKALRVIDIVDIWPDVLPFSKVVRRLFAPVLAIWHRSFTAAVASADLLLAVSERFLQEALPAFRGTPDAARRLYIGHALIPRLTRGHTGRLTIAYIGNIGHLCDLQTLLDAIAACGDTPKLLVIGDGDKLTWLLDSVKERGIPHEYFGVVYDEARLAEILREADLGFNGYRNTDAAFSYKATSYLASGLPLLNSMSGDLHELVSEFEIGFNYRSEDVEDLGNCLRAATPATLMRLRANAEKFFSEHLDQDQLKRELESWLCGHLHVVKR